MQRSAAQRHRMNRAANFAQSHLADGLDLDRLAEVACLSKFHFARVFSAHYKETPVQFLWRNRLEHGARALVLRRDKSITEIAMDFGFSSSQTFSRAFSQRFRLAPRILRSRGLGHIPNLSPAHGAKLSRLKLLTDRWEQIPVRIERRPQVRVAYIRHIGPYWNVDGGIAKCFEALERWARPRGLWTAGTELIGNCPNNATLTPAPHCIYDACIPVPDDISEDDVVSMQTIPAGTYGVQTVVGTCGELESAWNWLISTWLPVNGLACELMHSYESYLVGERRRDGPEVVASLCVRLKTASAANLS